MEYMKLKLSGLGIGYVYNVCYGRGIYNTSNAQKSLDYVRHDKNLDNENVTYMFFNAVIIGNVFEVYSTGTCYGSYLVGNIDKDKSSFANI